MLSYPRSNLKRSMTVSKARRGVVEYKLYPGEGHGRRKEENMRDACERALAFYEEILKPKQRG